MRLRGTKLTDEQKLKISKSMKKKRDGRVSKKSVEPKQPSQIEKPQITEPLEPQKQSDTHVKPEPVTTTVQEVLPVELTNQQKKEERVRNIDVSKSILRALSPKKIETLCNAIYLDVIATRPDDDDPKKLVVTGIREGAEKNLGQLVKLVGMVTPALQKVDLTTIATGETLIIRRED